MPKNFKKIALIPAALLTSSLLFGCWIFQQKISPYPFKTAKIELTQTGNFLGTSVIYIKGDKTMRETHAVHQAESGEQKIDTLYLENGPEVYQADLNAKTGTKSKNPIYQQLKNLSSEKRMEFLTKVAIGIDNATPLPKPKEQKDIAGQKCDLYNIQGISDLCIWNGIPIYENILFPEAGIDLVVTATKIELDADIPDSKFALPADLKIKDSSSQQ